MNEDEYVLEGTLLERLEGCGDDNAIILVEAESIQLTNPGKTSSPKAFPKQVAVTTGQSDTWNCINKPSSTLVLVNQHGESCSPPSTTDQVDHKGVHRFSAQDTGKPMPSPDYKQQSISPPLRDLDQSDSSGVSICVQCGVWLPDGPGFPASNQHTLETGHSLVLPVIEKGDQCQFRCLVCGSTMYRLHQVQAHMGHWNHRQFASLSLSSHPPAVPNKRTKAPRRSASFVDSRLTQCDPLIASPSPTGLPYEPSHDTNRLGQQGDFVCTRCPAVFDRSSQLPHHHRLTGHERFTRLMPCATGIAQETWNHSGRMIRGEVLPSVSQASSGLSTFLSNNISTISSQPKDIVIIAADQNLDEIQSSIQSLPLNISLSRSLYLCALCSRCVSSMRQLLSHATTHHKNINKMAAFVHTQISPTTLPSMSHACLLCVLSRSSGSTIQWHSGSPKSLPSSLHCLSCSQNPRKRRSQSSIPSTKPSRASVSVDAVPSLAPVSVDAVIEHEEVYHWSSCET